MTEVFEMPEMTARQELIGMYSDSYKDAHGIRPRWMNFDGMSDEEIEAGITENCRIANENYEQEQIWANEKVEEFKQLVQRTIEMGANDETTALRWLASSEEFNHYQDVEHFVWGYGILFTDYGRQLVKRIAEIVGDK
jgi:hypothetical protein